MRHFQVLIVVLAAGITVELGLVAMKLPTPTAQAQTQIPAPPAMQDPHEVLRAQLAALDKRLTAMEQQTADTTQTLRGAGPVISRTCRMVTQIWTRSGWGRSCLHMITWTRAQSVTDRPAIERLQARPCSKNRCHHARQRDNKAGGNETIPGPDRDIACSDHR